MREWRVQITVRLVDVDTDNPIYPVLKRGTIRVSKQTFERFAGYNLLWHNDRVALLMRAIQDDDEMLERGRVFVEKTIPPEVGE